MTEQEEFEFRLRFEKESAVNTKAKDAPTLKDKLLASIPGGIVRGLKDVIDTGAYGLAKGYDALTGASDPTLSSLITGQKTGEAERVRQMNEAGKAEFKAAQERTGNVVAPTIGRIGGNILATAPMLSFGGAATAAAGLPRLGTAIASGGMSTGARVAPGAVNMLADIGIRSAGGALGGGAAAGLVDPSSAGFGAAIGGAVPVVAKVAGAAGRELGSAISGRMAQQKALAKVSGALGNDASQAIADIQTYYPKGAENIPVSAAAATKNPALAVLEQGSRVKGSPTWYEFDQKQAKALFENVLKATDEAEKLGERLGQRSENWKAAWQKASEAQKPRVWANRMTQFADDLDLAAVSPDASNPAVRGVVDAIRGEIDRVGPNLNPGHLQQIRANLSGRANPMSPDAFKAAPRDSAAVKSIIKEIDDILNATTGGKWQKVIEGYAQESKSVQAAKAASKVRGAFLDETGRVRGVSADVGGDVAKVTEAGLGRAMDAARFPDKSLALSEPATARLEATLEAIRRQNLLQGVKRTATAGGGSDTMANAFAAQAARSGGTPNMLIQLIEGMQQIGTRKSDEALARLLSNPDELANALTFMNQQKSPNALAALAYRGAPVIAARPQ